MRNYSLRSYSRENPDGPSHTNDTTSGQERASPGSSTANNPSGSSEQLPSLQTAESVEESLSPPPDYFDLFNSSDLDLNSVRSSIQQMSIELAELRTNQVRQEETMTNNHDSMVSHLVGLRSWGNAIANENAYLRSELNRIYEEYNRHYHEQAGLRGELEHTKARPIKPGQAIFVPRSWR